MVSTPGRRSLGRAPPSHKSSRHESPGNPVASAAGERGRVVGDAPPRLSAGEAAAVDADDHRRAMYRPCSIRLAPEDMEVEGSGHSRRMGASRSSTTSCSTCAGPSASSSRSATCSRRPTSSRRSTTRRAPRAGSRTATSTPRSCSGCARPRARSARCCRSTRYAMEALDLGGYDLVISSSSAWAHGVIADEHAVHVCYCHNPFRYAWNARETTLAPRSPLGRAALGVVFQRWRQWDWIAAQRVDRYVANSETTRRRIGRYFGRDADRRPPAGRDSTASRPARGGRRLRRAHRAHAAQAHRGRGRGVQPPAPAADRRRRRARRAAAAAPGRPDGALRRAASATRAPRSCSPGRRALVVTATEEFGIAAVEAQAAGRPVIALAEGGVRETVVEGETGTFYERADARRAVGGRRALRRRRGRPGGVRRATPSASTSPTSATGCARVVAEAPAAERAPRRAPPAPAPRGLAPSPA